jgi:hypothetical protein
MSGRRSKQVRRLIWMAECGDVEAQNWVTQHMTFRQLQRATNRHLAIQARRAGRQK